MAAAHPIVGHALLAGGVGVLRHLVGCPCMHSVGCSVLPLQLPLYALCGAAFALCVRRCRKSIDGLPGLLPSCERRCAGLGSVIGMV